MEPDIFCTVNAGLYIWDGRSGLFVDSLHRGKRLGLSDTPEELLHGLRQRQGIFQMKNDFLFTHKHEDHFDEELVEFCKGEYPASCIYVPENGGLAERDVEYLTLGNYRIKSFRAVHDGKRFEKESCWIFLIEAGERKVLVCGDARINEEILNRLDRNCRGKIDAVFLNVYQLESGCGKELLMRIGPDRTFVYHIPFEKDDGCHYRKIAEKSVEKYQKLIPGLSVARPMSRISREIWKERPRCFS